MRVKRRFYLRVQDCSGQSIAEYLIIALLVAIVVVAAVRKFGRGMSDQVEGATTSVDSLTGSQPTIQTGASRGDDSVNQAGDEKGEASLARRRSRTGEQVHGRSSDDAAGSLAAEGVGSDEYRPVESIKVEWWMLGVFFILAGAIGFAVVFFTKKRKGKKIFSRKDKGLKGTTGGTRSG